MAKNVGSFMSRPWVFHYECHRRDDGVWNAVIYCQGSFPLAMGEGATRAEAECIGFNGVLHYCQRENEREARLAKEAMARAITAGAVTA